MLDKGSERDQNPWSPCGCHRLGIDEEFHDEPGRIAVVFIVILHQRKILLGAFRPCFVGILDPGLVFDFLAVSADLS